MTVGYSYLGQRFSIARHNADDTLDTTFGNNGIIYDGFGSAQSNGYGVAILADGKIVAVGNLNYAYPYYNFLVARYNTDGSLDNSFNGSGFATLDWFGGYYAAQFVAIQPGDQKIVVAGSARNGSPDNFAIARYNTDGSLDTSFDGDGKVSTAILNDANARGIALQPDGKILVVGQTYDGSVNNIALVLQCRWFP